MEVYVANCTPYKNNVCQVSNVTVLQNFDDVKFYLINYGKMFNDDTIDKQIEEVDNKHGFVVTIHNNNIKERGDCLGGNRAVCPIWRRSR